GGAATVSPGGSSRPAASWPCCQCCRSSRSCNVASSVSAGSAEPYEVELAMKLDIEGLTVEYGQVAAVRGLNLTVGHGELVALVGPSGCGKTTTLGFITGFIRPKSGRVRFDGLDVTDLPPQRRGIGYVFQDYAIYPHMTVRENIRFRLDAAKVDREKAEHDVDEIAGRMGGG